MSLQLRPDQMDKLAQSVAHKRWGYWDDPGVGKTPPACVYMYYLWSKLKVRTVWAMPSHLMKKNKDELLAWSNFDEADVAIVDGTRKQRDALIQSDAKVFITTFPGLVGKRGDLAEWEKYKAFHIDFNCVVLDEPHKYFSNDESSATQELYRCMRQVSYFLPMTGTLVKGRLDSAYPMLNIIEPRYYGNMRDFLAQHAVKDMWGNITGWRNHEKLRKVLDLTGSRVSFEELYGEREIVFFIEHVDMHYKQRKAYEQFKEQGFAELDKIMLDSTANEGVNLLRLRQILAHPEEIRIPKSLDQNGNVTEWDYGQVMFEPAPRDTQIQFHMEEHKRTGEPLLILSSLVKEQERLAGLAQSLGLRVGLINHKVPNAERFAIDEAFRKGDIDVVVGSPSTVSTGFNWPHLDHILFAALDFSSDDFIQAMMRAFRGKRTKPLRVTVVQYRDTIEDAIEGVLDKKSLEAHMVDDTYMVLYLAPWDRKLTDNVFSN